MRGVRLAHRSGRHVRPLLRRAAPPHHGHRAPAWQRTRPPRGPAHGRQAARLGADAQVGRGARRGDHPRYPARTSGQRSLPRSPMGMGALGDRPDTACIASDGFHDECPARYDSGYEPRREAARDGREQQRAAESSPGRQRAARQERQHGTAEHSGTGKDSAPPVVTAVDWPVTTTVASDPHRRPPCPERVAA